MAASSMDPIKHLAFTDADQSVCILLFDGTLIEVFGDGAVQRVVVAAETGARLGITDTPLSTWLTESSINKPTTGAVHDLN